MRMSGDRFLILTPCFCTTAGSSGVASWTRFWVCTSARFASAPTSKVSVST